MKGLTDGGVGNKRLVIEAKNLSHIVEIWVLNDESPLRVVHPVVEVSNGDLCPPVVLVVHLYVPVHPNGAHMVSAL